MPAAIFEIHKDGQVVKELRAPDIPSTKAGVENAVQQLCGLTPEQYQVYYVDEEDDPIMASGQEDYSIAFQTLEQEFVVFHIDLKIELPDLLLKKSSINSKDQQSEQLHSDSQPLKQVEKTEKTTLQNQPGENTKQKMQDKEQTKIQGKVQKENLNDDSESIKNNIQEKDIPKQDPQVPAVEQKGELLYGQGNALNEEDRMKKLESDSEENPPSSLSVEHSQPLNTKIQHKAQNNQDSPNEISQKSVFTSFKEAHPFDDKIQGNFRDRILSDDKLVEALFKKFVNKLPQVLKEECFKGDLRQQKQQKLEKVQMKRWCLVCQKQILTIPFYLNSIGQSICSSCETDYDQEDLLVKVRSQKHFKELLTVKVVSTLIDKEAPEEVKE